MLNIPEPYLFNLKMPEPYLFSHFFCFYEELSKVSLEIKNALSAVPNSFLRTTDSRVLRMIK